MSKNVSNQFKNIIKNGGAFYAYATVRLLNGTTFTLDSETDFFATGNSYSEDAGDGFPLGSALSKQISIHLDNHDERFSGYDFYGAEIVLYTETDIPGGTTERILEGTFTVIDSIAPGDVLDITAYDDMYKLDSDFTSNLVYPATLQQLWNELCDYFDVSNGSPQFKNNDFIVQTKPDGATGREMAGYIAQIAVGNAVADANGRLCIKSYDFSRFDESETVTPGEIETDSGIRILSEFMSDPNIGTDDVVITGITTSVTNDEGETSTVIYGDDEYAISIDNPLITGKEQTAIALIGDELIGLSVRPFSGDFVPNPTIEVMDLVYVVDKKDKVYKSFVTSHSFTYLGFSNVANNLESPQRNKSTYSNNTSKIYQHVAQQLNNQKTQWETAVGDLQDELENSSGLYPTEEKQPDGSTIYYFHDKPTLKESQVVFKITSQALAISTDGGNTYPTGITVDGEAIISILNTIGINADWINTGALTIEKDGQVMFRADVDTGQVDIVANSFSLRGQTIDEIAQGEVNEFVNGVYAPTLNEIQNQIDQKTETWYQPTDPSLQWTETEESALQDTTVADILDTNGEQIIGILKIGKTVHDGDIWKNSTTNVEYIYQDGQWIEMPIPDAVFDEIDGKARIFVTTPVPPYSERDLWMQGPDGDIMTCVHGRESGSFVSSDWEVKQKYTDDTAAIELDESLNQEGVFNRLTNNGEGQGLFLINGQLYVNASYINSGIFAVSKPGGTQTFYANTETGVVRIIADEFSLTNGDTIDSIAEDYANSAYENSVQYTEQQLQDYEPNLTQESVFNALTNNGQAQGIFMRNGQLYINMSYAQSGTLKLGGSNNVNGLLQVYNSSGVLVGTIDNVGAKFTNGNDWLQISQSLLTGGYGSTTDGVLDLSANYGDGSRNVVLESKTGDVILKSQNEFRVERQSGGMGYLVQSGGTDYFDDIGVSFGDTYPVIGIMYGEDDISGDPFLDIRLSNGRKEVFSASSGSSVDPGYGYMDSPIFDATTTQTFVCNSTMEVSGNIWCFTINAQSPPNLYNLSHVTSGGHLVFASNGITVAYLASSSKRYKDHVSDMSDEEALKILDIPVIKFKYKDGYLFPTDFLVDKEIPGFYAEDVEEVNPILCQYNEDGSVEDWNYRTMIPYMLKTMQIQQKRIDNLQTQINELKTMILNMKGA